MPSVQSRAPTRVCLFVAVAVFLVADCSAFYMYDASPTMTHTTVTVFCRLQGCPQVARIRHLSARLDSPDRAGRCVVVVVVLGTLDRCGGDGSGGQQHVALLQPASAIDPLRSLAGLDILTIRR